MALLDGDINLFRRLIGDFNGEKIDDSVVSSYLNDAALERSSIDMDLTLTADFASLPTIHKAETIYQAAINWWWNRAAEYADKHSQTVGQASMQVGEKYDRAMQMIQDLQMKLDALVNSGSASVVSIGNFSRFSKGTLTRLGGMEEEDTLAQ